jgi:hypothetical protein
MTIGSFSNTVTSEFKPPMNAAMLKFSPADIQEWCHKLTKMVEIGQALFECANKRARMNAM